MVEERKVIARFMALAVVLLALTPDATLAKPPKITTFEADITPPLGTPLCDALVEPAKEIVDRLKARGVVLLSGEKPIVLCALDWVGIGNGGYDAFREALAKAANTTPERVCMHCLHQHDAPGCDFDADRLLVPYGLSGRLFDPLFARQAIDRVAGAVERSLKSPRKITHVGIGKAKVSGVASARRVMGEDGKVKFVRYSATRDPIIRAEPEGVIDPYLQSLSFWDGEMPVAELTYYATHPQSYYGKGGVSCDFPGLARELRDRAQPNIFHVHFNGAGGNVTAGKYNDGNPMNRMVLAQRLADGMKQAFASTSKTPVSGIEYHVVPVKLPLSHIYNTKDLQARVADAALPIKERLAAARNLAWAKRCESGHEIELSCLHIGPAYVLHMPGELFVEYQLDAQKMRPKDAVFMAAYGDYGPGYIGTKIAYSQGGYETGPVSRVAPEVQEVLTRAMHDLLK
jgi:hypothetical protein